MKLADFSTFLFVVILGLGCTAVAGKADDWKPNKTTYTHGIPLKHPIELGAKCKDLFAKFLVWDNGVSWSPVLHYWREFAYAHDAKGSYACSYHIGPRVALDNCNSNQYIPADYSYEGRVNLEKSDVVTSFPPGTKGKDLGGCKIYAKSPVDGKLAIVWKEEPKQVAAKHQNISGKSTKQKPWAGYKTKLTDSNWELTIRYSDSGENYFAVVEKDGDRGRCEGAVDKLGNLQGADCTPNPNYCLRWLVGNVTRIELQNSGGSAGGADFVDKELAKQIKSEGAGKKR